MDIYARKTNKTRMLRGVAALTSYPARYRKLVPGLAGAFKLPPTKFIPLNTNDYFSYEKSLAPPKSIEPKESINIRSKSSNDPREQIGFGAVKDESDEDIAFTSPEKVDPSVLNAFVNPSFKTNSTTVIPEAVKKTEKRKKNSLPKLPELPAKKQKLGLKLKFSK
jgi:hypothetical protein